MSEMKIAEVNVTVRLPYDEHDEDIRTVIKRRASHIGEDLAFLASWYGVEADQLRENEDLYATAHVQFET